MGGDQPAHRKRQSPQIVTGNRLSGPEYRGCGGFHRRQGCAPAGRLRSFSSVRNFTITRNDCTAIPAYSYVKTSNFTPQALIAE